MDKYPLYLDGDFAGELTVAPKGMYEEYWAVCKGGEPGLLRAYLVGETGEYLLGVLAPEGEGLSIRRRVSRQETKGAGKLLRCEARRCGQEAWEQIAAPEGLLRLPYFAHLLKGVSGVLSRREKDRLLVAAPYRKDGPFPLPPLFCFARICPVGEGLYAVFAFDAQGTPLMP